MKLNGFDEKQDGLFFLHEIDMIFEKQGELIPIEIKYKHQLRSSDFKGIQKYLAEYPDIRYSFLVNFADNTSHGQTKLVTPFELHTIYE